MKQECRYITSTGKLSRKDFSLCFRKDNKNNYIPIEGIKELYIMNEVTINTKLLDFLAQNKIVVHFFNYYGNYSGTYYPRDKYISGRLRINQFNKFNEDRLDIAKNIVCGIAKNMQYLLNNKYKSGHNLSIEDIKFFDIDNKKLSKENNIKNILATEGMLWNKFYSTFKNFLDEEFVFNKRVKRPPDNPINAMISFGNSILYSKVITQIYHTHLDQSVSFLHEPSESRFSLALDIAEVFKLVIIFPLIFSLINKKMIKVDKHFEQKLNYCILNDEGKKIFLLNLEKKLNTSFKHQTLNRKVTYLNAIKIDSYKLIKTIMENKSFEPFSLKEMV